MERKRRRRLRKSGLEKMMNSARGLAMYAMYNPSTDTTNMASPHDTDTTNMESPHDTDITNMESPNDTGNRHYKHGVPY